MNTPAPYGIYVQKLALLAFVSMSVSLAGAEPGLNLDLGNGIRLELVEIQGGSFTQGSADLEPLRQADETRRQVTLTRNYLLGKFPVTRGQFARFVAATGYRTEAETGTSGGFGWNGNALVQNRQYHWRNPGFAQTDDHPVTGVTHGDAQRFCQWLSSQCRRPFQLPTEAEWEYACRAGTTTAWHNGNDEKQAADIAWFKPLAENATHPVASRQANAWNLHIVGNVFEWCRDWYGPYTPGPVTNPEQTNPNLSDKPRRILRGGSWLGGIAHTRSAARYRNTPASRNADNGFRVLTYVPAPATPPPVQLERPTGAVVPPPATPPTPTRPMPMPVPNVVVHHSASSFALGGLLCPLFGLGLVIVAIVAAVRSLGRDTTSPAASGPGLSTTRSLTSYGPINVRTELADDGFWLLANATMTGYLIHYHLLAGDQERDGQILCQPGADGRQFVYTGARPEKVQIMKTEATDDDVPPIISPGSDFSATDIVTPVVISESLSHGPFHRPSAY
jgi:formylglycine-generating enzyme required for sulfatase activity